MYCQQMILPNLVSPSSARRAVRRGRKVRRFGYSGSFSRFRDICRDACGLKIPHRHRDKDWRDYSGKSDKDDRDYVGKSDKDDRDYSGKSEKDDRDYSGKSGKDDRDGRDKGGKSDKVASEDEGYDEDKDKFVSVLKGDSKSRSSSKGKHRSWGKGKQDSVSRKACKR
jgi:hypothetical protein